MATATQQNRRLYISTPLGDDVLLLTEFSGREEMSRLFSYHAELASENDNIDPAGIVGKNVTIVVDMPDETPRFFNGFVSKFVRHGANDRLTLYTAEIVPWLWFLTRTADCRIFQTKTVPQIISAIFDERGLKDYDISGITGTHNAWDYCVQYRETAFNFVSRLMEQEGIFYFFRHDNGKHTMVLADGSGAYKDAPENQVRLSAASVGAPDRSDNLSSWEHHYTFTSGAWSQTDFNFETPTTDLSSNTKTLVKLDNIDTLGLFDYPGVYPDKTTGDAVTKMRMEEVEAAYDIVRGSSFCRSFAPGLRFTVQTHSAQQEEGNAFVLTAVEHHCTMAGSYVSGGSAGNMDYMNHFECVPDKVAFRPARLTPKPTIHGVQTAIVVGPSGQEIYTDQYGRVKVHFHWDHDSPADGNSSCWIRVAQVWAGKQWGATFLPRIGHEVVVQFLEGDPDRPLVVGSVYNAQDMPPYALPANKTRTTIKSNSTIGSGGFNEIRFDDKKGSEQIFIHGEKDCDVRIKNDSLEWIGHDRHLHVVNMQFEHVEVDRNESIDRDHLEQIGRDRHTTITGKEAKQVGGSLSLKVGGDVAEVFSGNHSEQTTGSCYVKADTIVIEGMSNVTIKVGGNYIAIGPDGIKINSTATMEMDAAAMMTIKGAMVMIN
jgi:type VI secretion system secreted protein VgrG